MRLLTRGGVGILLRDDPAQHPETDFSFITSYDEIMAAPADDVRFPDFDKMPGHNLLFGTTGIRRPSPIPTASLCFTPWACRLGSAGFAATAFTFDVYMPITVPCPGERINFMRRRFSASSRSIPAYVPSESDAADRRGGLFLLPSPIACRPSCRCSVRTLRRSVTNISGFEDGDWWLLTSRQFWRRRLTAVSTSMPAMACPRPVRC